MLLQNCSNCGQAVANDSKFCDHCGTSLVKKYLSCDSCQHKNALDAAFCGKCSAPLTINESLQKEYLGHFMRALRERIVDDHRSKKVDAYLKAFYDSGFHQTFLTAADQLGNEASELKKSMLFQADKKATLLVNNRIQDLLDYFIIHHCKSINTVSLPPAILKYQNKEKTDINLVQMVLAYLDMDAESYPYHIDFLKMEVEHLKNASNSFLFPAKAEKIWLITDLSEMDYLPATGMACKEGFAITDTAIYWKAPFETAQSIRFSNLVSIKREQEWLLLNGLFFNSNQSLNLKVLYLLRKLKALYK